MNSNTQFHPTIAVIGLGYVGLPLAISFSKKYPLIGFDINVSRIKSLQNGIDNTKEASEEDLVLLKKIEFTNESDKLKRANVFIVTVPTPVDIYNKPDLTPLQKASETVAKSLKKNDIVIYESTVFPGCTEEFCVPILEKISGLKFNQDFFCGYSPERINPGDKLHRLETIIKVTSGSTKETLDKVDNLYSSIITAGTYPVSSIKIAEAAKVIENSQRDINIAFVNELSLIFDRMGINTKEVLDAAGSKWNFLKFTPGLVGGHCIGVDPYYLTHKAESLGYHPQVILAGRKINDSMGSYIANKTIKLMIQKGIDVAKANILILGITFKENCPDIRNSKVNDIIKELGTFGLKPDVYDPWAAKDEVFHEYGLNMITVIDQKYDGIILAVSHQEFLNLNFNQFKNNPSVLMDVKCILPLNLADASL